MANGTNDYALGEIKTKVYENERRIGIVEVEQKTQQTWQDKTTGTLNAIKYLVGFAGVGFIANFIQNLIN